MEIARGSFSTGRQHLWGYDEMEFAFAKVVPGAGEIESRTRLLFEAKNAAVESPRTFEIRDQQAGVKQFPKFHAPDYTTTGRSQFRLQAAARALDSRS